MEFFLIFDLVFSTFLLGKKHSLTLRLTGLGSSTLAFLSFLRTCLLTRNRVRVPSVVVNAVSAVSVSVVLVNNAAANAVFAVSAVLAAIEAKVVPEVLEVLEVSAAVGGAVEVGMIFFLFP